MRSASSRASTSTMPPGAKGTMMRSGRAGQASCAAALRARQRRCNAGRRREQRAAAEHRHYCGSSEKVSTVSRTMMPPRSPGVSAP